MAMVIINWYAVLLAGISAFVLMGVWYSPALFGKAWMKENKFSIDDVRRGNKGKIFGIGFLASLLIAANLGMFLADPAVPCPDNCFPKADIVVGSLAGLMAGLLSLCFVAIFALIEHKTFRYILINGGYCILAAVLMGAIIGVWR